MSPRFLLALWPTGNKGATQKCKCRHPLSNPSLRVLGLWGAPSLHTEARAYLNDYMNYKLGALFHILPTPIMPVCKVTMKPFKGRLAPKVQTNQTRRLPIATLEALSHRPHPIYLASLSRPGLSQAIFQSAHKGWAKGAVVQAWRVCFAWSNNGILQQKTCTAHMLMASNSVLVCGCLFFVLFCQLLLF